MCLERAHHVAGGPRARPGFDQRVQLCLMGEAAFEPGEAWVAGPGGAVERIDQTLPLVIGRDGDCDPCIVGVVGALQLGGAAVYVVRGGDGVVVAVWLR